MTCAPIPARPRAARRPPPSPPVARGSVAVSSARSANSSARRRSGPGPPTLPGSHTAPRASMNAAPSSTACAWPSSARTQSCARDRWRRRDATARPATIVAASIVAQRVERQEKQRAGVRRRVPDAHRFGDARDRARAPRAPWRRGSARRAAPDAWSALMKSLNGPSTAPSPNCSRSRKQTRGRRRETDALALERVERVDLSLQRRVHLVGAEQLGARASPRARASRDRRRAPPRARSPLRRRARAPRRRRRRRSRARARSR